MKLSKRHIEELLDGFQKLLELWVNFRKFFKKSLSNEPITKDEEREFLATKSAIAKYQRSLAQKTKELLYYGNDKMTELLRQSISVSHLRALPRPDKEILYKTWHYVFIFLGRTLGAFKFMGEGYVPQLSHIKTASVTVAQVKGMTSKKAQAAKMAAEKLKQVITIIFLLAVIAVVVFLLIRRLQY